MKLSDMKLLLDVAYAESCASDENGMLVERGLVAARDRLVRLGLLISNPSNASRVSLTTKGSDLVTLKLSETDLGRRAEKTREKKNGR